MTIDDRFLVIVTGPTAVGKTLTAIRLATHFRSEIISADSRQFYSGMKIGTAFPSQQELEAVPHHFAGHLSIYDAYNVSRFEADALAVIENCFRSRPVCVMTGGSGLYIDAVVKGIDTLPDPDPALRESLKMVLAEQGTGALAERLRILDPEYHARVDLHNPVRLIRALEVCITTGVPYSVQRSGLPRERNFTPVWIGLTLPREDLNRRINERVDRMMDAGLLEEARRLFPMRHLNALQTVGYRELFDHLEGMVSLEEAVEKIKTNTRRYAKRQLTWFSNNPDIKWFSPDDFTGILDHACRVTGFQA